MFGQGYPVPRDRLHMHCNGLKLHVLLPPAWCEGLTPCMQIPVTSVEIEVDPGCRYEGVPCFSHFGEGIAFCGGINKPKRVVCFDR